MRCCQTFWIILRNSKLKFYWSYCGCRRESWVWGCAYDLKASWASRQAATKNPLKCKARVTQSTLASLITQNESLDFFGLDFENSFIGIWKSWMQLFVCPEYFNEDIHRHIPAYPPCYQALNVVGRYETLGIKTFEDVQNYQHDFRSRLRDPPREGALGTDHWYLPLNKGLNWGVLISPWMTQATKPAMLKYGSRIRE